jgi:hypothetical protein
MYGFAYYKLIFILFTLYKKKKIQNYLNLDVSVFSGIIYYGDNYSTSC